MSLLFARLVARLAVSLETSQPKRTITYAEIGKSLSPPHGEKYLPRSIHLARALGALVEEDVEFGNPLRSALVVRADSGMPGKGFFEKAIDMGADLSLEDRNGLKKFWAAQLTGLGVALPRNLDDMDFDF